MRPHSFKEGDLVPRKIFPNAKDSKMEMYEEPYVAKHIFSERDLILTDPKGDELIHPANTNMVKLCHPREFNQRRIQRVDPKRKTSTPLRWDWEGEASSHVRSWQPCHHAVTKPMQSRVWRQDSPWSPRNAHTS
ncbi:hypothetical protein CR513_28314, partial [Mucuna pruriens]